MDIKNPTAIKLIITKTEFGYTVYDENNKSRIDMFPDTEEGYFRLMDFVAKYLMQPIEK